ncbi:MAG: anhydro-N-acetylmuramic acid kinase [Bacteroidota bacterium]
MNKQYKDIIIGLMSGTSLDGIDLCACNFKNSNNQIIPKIIAAETFSYPTEWIQILKSAGNFNALNLIEADRKLGAYFGDIINSFIQKHELQPLLVSSHGHTIFHQPEKGFTFQMGSGAVIAAKTGVNTICDFRSKDVALGGQGAPLVPIGDQLLFGNYAACLNLGGIANISFEKNEKRMAFDICPVNMALNFYAEKLNLNYDDEGKIAASGEVNINLLDELNQLDFYHQFGPKSIGREWFENHFLPILDESEKQEKCGIPDLLRTIVEHIAIQHAQTMLHSNIKGPVLVTGGGALNKFLINRIKAISNTDFTVPDISIVNYKEALVFAFLGWLYQNDSINTLASATGSTKNSIGGALYKGH